MAQPKRIIVCCDGTWMNSLGEKGGDPPSNVTRISRVIKRTCNDGTSQVIFYNPGVGSGGTKLDQLTGGAFGMGLDSDIRIVYNFLCNNYADGDSIILTGFSRGAFTARSVADMIATVGLLTPEGLDHFYAIFEDYENMGDDSRPASKFLYDQLPSLEGKKGKERTKVENERKVQYRDWLRDVMHFTRDKDTQGNEIRIKALGVWDTVGTLGIPPAPVLGIRGTAKQWRFTNTQVSNKVENAFQALALDEPRFAFRPSLWERVGDSKTNLKQVWFPGNHGNVGGGWYDQQIANITLAWMCDQLSSIGVEFSLPRMKDTFVTNLNYSATHPYPTVPQPSWKLGLFQPDVKPWGVAAVCPAPAKGVKCDGANCTGAAPGHNHEAGPLTRAAKLATLSSEVVWTQGARPWGLGQTRYPDSWLQVMAGSTVRHPGLFMRADTNATLNVDTNEPLLGTNERIHSCVRVRLACGGLATDDGEAWKCEALTAGADGKRLWELRKGSGLDAGEAAKVKSFTPRELAIKGGEYAGEELYQTAAGDGEWRWVYVGAGKVKPPATTLAEEPMVGYWERLLLKVLAGKEDVWRWAEKNPPKNVMPTA